MAAARSPPAYPAEQVILSAQSHRAQRPLGGVVVDLDSAVAAIPRERTPATEHVADRLGKLGPSTLETNFMSEYSKV
jgi:hypothetical protein